METKKKVKNLFETAIDIQKSVVTKEEVMAMITNGDLEKATLSLKEISNHNRKSEKDNEFLQLRNFKKALFEAVTTIPENLTSLDIIVGGIRFKLSMPKEKSETIKSVITTRKNQEVQEVKVKRDKGKSIIEFFQDMIAKYPEKKYPESIIKYNSTQSALVWLAKNCPIDLKEYQDSKAQA